MMQDADSPSREAMWEIARREGWLVEYMHGGVEDDDVDADMEEANAILSTMMLDDRSPKADDAMDEAAGDDAPVTMDDS